MVYLSVGSTVVAAFHDPKRATKALKRLAPGCGATIKKVPLNAQCKERLRVRSMEAQRVRYIKPGEFRL